VQIRLHKLEDEVEVASVVRFDYPLQLHDVCVLQLVQNRHLSVRSLCVYVVLKGVEYFFQSVFSTRLAMHHFPDVAVGSAAQEVFQLEASQNVALDFFTHYI